MKRANKATKKLVRNDLVIAGVLLGILFVMIGSVFTTMMALAPGYVGVSRMSLPLVKTTGAEAELRSQYFVPLTSCRGDNRSQASRAAMFNAYFSVNKDGDRAVMRGCNDIDQVYARVSNNKWYPMFTINADMTQDNAVRKACKIEDITKGEDDTRPENQSMNALEVVTCQNFLTNVTY